MKILQPLKITFRVNLYLYLTLVPDAGQNRHSLDFYLKDPAKARLFVQYISVSWVSVEKPALARAACTFLGGYSMYTTKYWHGEP